MSTQTKYPRVSILGVEVDALTRAQAVDYIVTRAGERQRPAGCVVKPYVEFLDRATADADIRGLLNAAELSLADGVALLWAAHFLADRGGGAGQQGADRRHGWFRDLLRFKLSVLEIIFRPAALRSPLPEKFAGTNFTWPLLEAAAAAGRSVYLIGSPIGSSIEHTRDVILKRLPSLNIVGALDGHDPTAAPGAVTADWLAATAADLRAADPDLVLVGMGFPLQERVAAALAPKLTHGVLIGEGGTFDYASFGGARRKAPRLFQATGLEWFWRLLLEPSRLRRQLAIPRFMRAVWRSRRET
jgi:N-acetylglucosaminyldiphosphoundecaprenol N-acetyl-beta-D-mannosaminyltransferase